MTQPLTQYSSAFTPARLPRQTVGGLYVHVPFCFHKCHYCDFYSITRQTPDRMGRFVDRILHEADQWLGSPIHIRPRTIFFGGGTPSLLPLAEMRRLIAGLSSRFSMDDLQEWTVEVNPATAAGDYCQMLRDSGVNRLSFGAQSFNRRDLTVLERHHDPADVPRSIDLARQAGFKRLNLDLIYAVPGQSLDTWKDNLEQALALGTEHLSCYALTYEPNTPLAVRKRLGQVVAAEESVELDMLHHTRQRLAEAGLPAYEVSNHARPGAECQHNLVYWQGGDYVALGPSGASHVQGWRWKNRGHLGEWERAVDDSGLPAAELEQLDPAQRRGELAMLLLRLASGIVYDDFERATGCDPRPLLAGPIARYQPAGLVVADEHGVRLTERGISVADGLATEFMEACRSAP